MNNVDQYPLTKVRISRLHRRNASFKSPQGFIIPPFHILGAQQNWEFVNCNIWFQWQIQWFTVQYHSVCTLHMYVCVKQDTWVSMASYSLQASLLLVDNVRPSALHACKKDKINQSSIHTHIFSRRLWKLRTQLNASVKSQPSQWKVFSVAKIKERSRQKKLLDQLHPSLLLLVFTSLPAALNNLVFNSEAEQSWVPLRHISAVVYCRLLQCYHDCSTWCVQWLSHQLVSSLCPKCFSFFFFFMRQLLLREAPSPTWQSLKLAVDMSRTELGPLQMFDSTLELRRVHELWDRKCTLEGLLSK